MDQRDTSTLPALDGLRAVAVLAVLLTHVGFQTGLTYDGQLGAVLSRLDFGVTLFFLLSGFLLYRPYATAHLGGGSGPRLGRYLRNRALRILPAYWLLVVVTVPLLAGDAATLGELTRHLLMLQTASAGHLQPGLTQSWSLIVEAGFYLLLPLLAGLTRPRAPRSADRQAAVELALLAGMVLVALGWKIGVHAYGLGDERVTTVWLPGYLDWFALGMGAAVLRAWHGATGRARTLEELAGAAGTCLLVAVLLLWLATTPFAGPRDLTPPTAWEALVKHGLYGLAAAALLLPLVLGRRGAAGASAWERFLASRPARRVGRISYGIFLWHLVALDLVYRLPFVEPFEGRPLLVLALVTPLSFLLAELSLRLVELPALRRKRPAGAPPG